MARIVPLEPIFDLLTAHLDDDRSPVRAGVGVLTVVERGEQVRHRPLRERCVPLDRGVTGEVPEQVIDGPLDGALGVAVGEVVEEAG